MIFEDLAWKDRIEGTFMKYLYYVNQSARVVCNTAPVKAHLLLSP